MNDDGMTAVPLPNEMTDKVQKRAAVAFRGWLADGLLSVGINTVQALADDLGVPVQTTVALWHDTATPGFLGMRSAYALQGYLSQHAWHFVVHAGAMGDKATLAKPVLSRIIDELMEGWPDDPTTSDLAPLTRENFKRLIMLAVRGALGQLRQEVLCDTVDDDGRSGAVGG